MSRDVSFILEGLPSNELLKFAKSIKMDQTVRGATRVEVSLFQDSDGKDKLEAKNIFSDLNSRDEYISRLRPPNSAGLADMGVQISTHTGSLVPSSLTSSVPASTTAVSLSDAGTGAQLDKAAWPELVGTSAADAMTVIAVQRPDVEVLLVPQGAMVTMDMRMDRVRVFHDGSTEKVTTAPRVG